MFILEDLSAVYDLLAFLTIGLFQILLIFIQKPIEALQNQYTAISIACYALTELKESLLFAYL